MGMHIVQSFMQSSTNLMCDQSPFICNQIIIIHGTYATRSSSIVPWIKSLLIMFENHNHRKSIRVQTQTLRRGKGKHVSFNLIFIFPLFFFNPKANCMRLILTFCFCFLFEGWVFKHVAILILCQCFLGFACILFVHSYTSKIAFFSIFFVFYLSTCTFFNAYSLHTHIPSLPFYLGFAHSSFNVYIYNYFWGVFHCLLLLCFHVSSFMRKFVASSNALSILLSSSTLNSLFQFSCSLCCFYFFHVFVGLALVGKDIVYRFIIEYSSLRDFGS